MANSRAQAARDCLAETDWSVQSSEAPPIRGEGFLPGLWVAPFSVDRASQLYREHPDWMVQGPDGPLESFGAFGLDLSRDDALGFLSDIFGRVFDGWGYEYVKIDFLVHCLLPGRRRDPTLTSAQLFRRGLSAIRQQARDRIVLCCGSPFGPQVGPADGVRIGMDVSSRWSVPVNTAAWPAGNLNVRAAAIPTIWLQWIHRHW